jgi:hypothetical protein
MHAPVIPCCDGDHSHCSVVGAVFKSPAVPGQRKEMDYASQRRARHARTARQ